MIVCEDGVMCSEIWCFDGNVLGFVVDVDLGFVLVVKGVFWCL